MEDNGNFTCHVFNKFGYINKTFELVIYGECLLKGYILDLSPNLRDTQKMMSIKEKIQKNYKILCAKLV